MSKESAGAPLEEKKAPDPDPGPSPFADKRLRVQDEDAASRPWFQSIGLGNRLGPGAVPAVGLSLLNGNGYFLHESKERSKYNECVNLTHLCLDSSPLLLEAGPLNVVFLNDYIKWSGGDSSLDKIYLDGGVTIGGAFRAFAPELREWLGTKGIVDEAADAEIIRMFRSDRVVENNYPDSLRINYSKPVSKESDFLEGGLVVLPKQAGYWRLEFPRVDEVLVPMPTRWKNALNEARFSYKFYPTSGDLFFSNTMGAKYGLPPTAKHLGLPKLNIGKESQPDQVVLPDGCCPDCSKSKEELLALQGLVTELLSRSKTPGAYSFPAGVTKLTTVGNDYAFQYRGKVIVKK